MNKLFYGLLGLLLGIGLMYGATTGWDWRQGEMSDSHTSKNIDAYFIEQMIPHHEDAIAMADVALQKAEHQEIKQLAEGIKTSQSREIEKMKKWHADWFNKHSSLITVASAHTTHKMQMGMMGDATDIERLENAKPFDKAFIEEMILHHQMAIMMAEMLQITTEREEMEALAHDIIDAQTAEVEQMRTWYRSWYGM